MQRLRVRAERRVELHGDDERPLVEQPRELRALARRRRLRRLRALADEQRPGGRDVVVDRRADRRDLRRRRAAAAADDPRAEGARLRRELAEVRRRCMREDDALAGHAREADVRERREHGAVRAHLAQRIQRCRRACAVIRAERRDVERAQPLGGGARRDAGQCLAVGVEGHERDDRQARHGTDGGDRRLEIVEVEERLDREQVGAPALEDLRLLRVRPRRVRADRAGDEDLAAGHLARLAREPDALGVDPLEVVVEEGRRKLRPVGAERVRLDEVGAGADVAEVDVDDGLRGADVRLLRAAEARDGARDERAHATVGDDRRPGREPLEEPAHRGQSRGSSPAARLPMSPPTPSGD